MLGRTALAFLFAARAAFAAAADTVPPDTAFLKLEKVVLVQRHGVRSPTQGARTLNTWADKPWPAWEVAAGELTPHGARVVELVARTLGNEYRAQGLLPASCAKARRATLVWADGKDKRTRDSGRFLARGLLPACGTKARISFRADNDPVFDSITGQCRLDPAEASSAVMAALGPQGLVDPPTRAALDAIQQAMAPAACTGGAGYCLNGPSEVDATAERIDIKGPLPVASEAAEIFLLQYAQGMPPDSVAWGQGRTVEAVGQFMAAHERADKLTRQLDYVAQRRGARMAQLILDTLNGAAAGQPQVRPHVRVLALAGHDTNLSNMAGVFGLEWRLEGQPDSTAPATALAFELWRDARTHDAFVRPRVFHLTLSQMRDLQPAAAQANTLSFGRCSNSGPASLCPLSELTRTVENATPAICKPVAAGKAR